MARLVAFRDPTETTTSEIGSEIARHPDNRWMKIAAIPALPEDSEVAIASQMLDELQAATVRLGCYVEKIAGMLVAHDTMRDAPMPTHDKPAAHHGVSRKPFHEALAVFMALGR
jgi:hypothetical protein